MNDLIPANFPVRLNDLGLSFEADLSFEQWSEIGSKVGQVARTSLFWVGDWINYGQDRWNGGNRFESMPEEQRAKYEAAMKLTGLEMDTLQIAAHVARRIPLADRKQELSFSHHRLIARVKDDDKRREWLQKTQRSHLSTRRLRASLNADRIVSEQELQSPTRKGEETHLLWIRRLQQWWIEKSADPEYEEMTREQLETVLNEFSPILGIVEELRDRAQKAVAYLDV